MIDRNQGLIARHGQRLGADKAHHHAADQPRPGGRSNGVHIIKAKPCIGHHPFEHGGKPFGVRARRDFGHHPAIGRVFGFLAGDALRHDGAICAHQRHGGFIAARLNPQNKACAGAIRAVGGGQGIHGAFP